MAKKPISKDVVSAGIYGGNYLLSLVPKIGEWTNPHGAVYGALSNIAQRFERVRDSTVGSVLRLADAGLGAYFGGSAIFNIATLDIGEAFFDATMAYQLLVNQGALKNLRDGTLKRDLRCARSRIEDTIERHK